MNLTGMSEAGKYIVILLMLIGGSPGSTAGGMKTTTAAVLLGTAVSTFGRQKYTHFFGRRVDEDVVRNAVTILLMYLVLVFAGGLVISLIEGLPMLTCLFETASAVGTVGLSLGITPGLGRLSKLILTMLMFMGRVGGLTLVFAARLGVQQSNGAMLPKEKITIG